MKHASRKKPLAIKDWDFFASILFAFIFFDSLATYFANPYGITIPIASSLALLGYVFYIVFLRGTKSLPPTNYLIWLGLLILFFLIGIATAPDIGLSRVRQLVSAVLAFLIGYSFWLNARNTLKLAYFFIFLCGAYALVCMLALEKVNPEIFPINAHIWADQDGLHERPAITTDQNFQIFYLFPIVAILILRIGVIKTLLSLIILFISYIILARIQTRSGVLVLGGGFFFAMLMFIWMPNLSKSKMLYVSMLLVVGIIAKWQFILEQTALLLGRFYDAGAASSAVGRWHSFTYLFDVGWNPLFWLPRGNEPFNGGKIIEGAYAYVPHSNLTAVFLESGLIGLIAWIVLFIIPIFKLANYFIKKRLDEIGCCLLICSVVALVAQLSLNVPVMDQVWLWGGSVLGGLHRIKADNLKMQNSKSTLGKI